MTTANDKNAPTTGMAEALTVVCSATQAYTLTPFLSRALPLATLNIDVFPVDAKGKEPKALGFLNKRGKMARLSRTTHATNDAALIEAKWGGEEYADCNVGCFFRGANYGVDIE